MTQPETAPGTSLPPLTTAQRWIVAGLAAGSGGLAAMAFLGMFTAVRDAMLPWFHQQAWMIPVGTDLGIVLTSAFSVFLEAIDMRLWWLRYVTLAFLGLQLGLNVGAAHGDPLGSAGHAVLPLLFITVIEVWQYFIRKRRNLVNPSKRKRKRDRIPLARYAADWKGTWQIRRRMILWGIDSYSDALDMTQQVLRAEAALKHVYGEGWHAAAPADLLLSLNTAKYLDDACAAIAKMRSDYDKGRNSDGGQKRNPNAGNGNGGGAGKAGNGSGGDHDGDSAQSCCEAHRALSARQSLPADAAARVNAEHIAVHGNAIGADKLGRLFQLGSANARALRDRLRESGPGSGGESGPWSEAESGAESGPVGQADSRTLVGAGAASGPASTDGGS